MVIALGDPVHLDIANSNLTQGILIFFRRKLKNCIEIALINKFEFSHNQCRGTMPVLKRVLKFSQAVRFIEIDYRVVA